MINQLLMQLKALFSMLKVRGVAQIRLGSRDIRIVGPTHPARRGEGAAPTAEARSRKGVKASADETPSLPIRLLFDRPGRDSSRAARRHRFLPP